MALLQDFRSARWPGNFASPAILIFGNDFGLTAMTSYFSDIAAASAFPIPGWYSFLLRHMVRIFNNVEYLSHPDVNRESLEVEVMCGSWRARFSLVKTRHLSACSLEGKHRFARYFSNSTPLETQQGKLYSIDIVRKNGQYSIVQRFQTSLPPAGSCHCCRERHRSWNHPHGRFCRRKQGE